jgi:outer membrane receptor protein involved in Fe transport
MQLNLTGFYYDYKNYQISEIINRASTNDNIDAEVYGAELRVDLAAAGRPAAQRRDRLPRHQDQGRRLDRHLQPDPGQPGPDAGEVERASNCVVSTASAADGPGHRQRPGPGFTPNPFNLLGVCTIASAAGAGTNINGTGAIAAGTNAFGGLVSEGVPVDLSGNQLPNAPHWTISLGAQYTMNFGDWDATLRGDYYHQTKTFARIYNSDPDRIKAWDNVNLTLTVENKDLASKSPASSRTPPTRRRSPTST